MKRRRLKYSKEIEDRIKKGSSLRSIRKKMRLDSKKGQMGAVRNIVVGFISAVVSITIFLFASPHIQSIVESTTSSMDGGLAVFVITILPYFILLLVFLVLFFALRGDPDAV